MCRIHPDEDMSFSAADLIALLDLEPIEHNIYRGQNRDIGTGMIYGGQVLAQALVAETSLSRWSISWTGSGTGGRSQPGG